MANEPTDVDIRFHRLIEEQVSARAAAVAAEREATQVIAELAVQARQHGVVMARLAEWIRVVDPKTGELRSVSRQAVDQLVAAHEKRPRAPRRRGKAAENGAGKINREAFGG